MCEANISYKHHTSQFNISSVKIAHRCWAKSSNQTFGKEPTGKNFLPLIFAPKRVSHGHRNKCNIPFPAGRRSSHARWQISWDQILASERLEEASFYFLIIIRETKFTTQCAIGLVSILLLLVGMEVWLFKYQSYRKRYNLKMSRLPAGHHSLEWSHLCKAGTGTTCVATNS